MDARTHPRLNSGAARVTMSVPFPPDTVAAAQPQRLGWDAGKRGMDIAMAGTALLLLFPLLVVIALLVKRTSPGPVLFRQMRYGKAMEPFIVLKFRTMTHGASAEAHRAYIAEHGRQQPCAATGLQKLTDDPRVTNIGRVLRATSADELPQLLNVLSGEMAIVGPRPALDYELECYEPEHFDRFDVKPGLTGLWQVSGRSRLGFREMLDLDVQYARTAGPKLDLSILLRTPKALLRGEAA